MTVEGGCKIESPFERKRLRAPIGSQNELEHNFHELKTVFPIIVVAFHPTEPTTSRIANECLEDFIIYFGNFFFHRVPNGGGGHSIPKVIKHEKPRGFVYRKHTKRKITHLSRAMIKTLLRIENYKSLLTQKREGKHIHE